MRNSAAILQKGDHKHKRVPIHQTNGAHKKIIGYSHLTNLSYSIHIIMD